MAKHAGPHDRDDRVAVTTIAVVGLLGLVVAVLAVFRPQPTEDTATPTAAPASSTDPARTVAPSQGVAPPLDTLSPAPTVEPQRVAERGRAMRRKAEAQARRIPQEQPVEFRVATFNVLGASHTRSGGNKRGWAPATTRMGLATQLLRQHDVDVVGFQEFEDPQYHAFMTGAAGQWGVYPGTAGDRGAVRQSIAWRLDTWDLVEAATIPIPYFHGNRVPMPYVRLRNLATGRDVYFVNVHNPASTPRWGDNERWRDLATSLEIGLVQRLQGEGVPVVLTGDFNERDEVYCKLTGTGLVAANGGSVGTGCAPPPRMDVDWIFGSPAIEFSGYVSDKSPLVRRATDHPLVLSDAVVPPEPAATPAG